MCIAYVFCLIATDGYSQCAVIASLVSWPDINVRSLCLCLLSKPHPTPITATNSTKYIYHLFMYSCWNDKPFQCTIIMETSSVMVIQCEIPNGNSSTRTSLSSCELHYCKMELNDNLWMSVCVRVYVKFSPPKGPFGEILSKDNTSTHTVTSI